MELRKINLRDAAAQWAYTTALPADENGLTNPYSGVSLEEYTEKVLPELISYEHPVGMPDWFVPETYFYLWDGDSLVGEFRVRHCLTEALRSGAGHIGYSIRRDLRGRGYGTAGLKLTLEAAEDIVREEEFFLRVNKGNTASLRVMLKNGAYRAGEDETHYFLRIPRRARTAGPEGTLDWYRENAEEFIARTENAEMTAEYRRFLGLVPPGGRILDLGCGAGGAALYFTRRGYPVLAADGCPELCEHTRRRVGCPVRLLRFEELEYVEAFDGVWACASLLHVRRRDLPGVLRRIRRALRAGGVFYASFKYGEGEREAEGRFFSDFTEDSLRALLEEAGGFCVRELWTSGDVRPGRENERWVNVLCGVC